MKRFLVTAAVTAALLLPAAALAQPAAPSAPAGPPADKPVALLAVIMGPSGPVVVIDDMAGQGGWYASEAACKTDILKQNGSLQDDLHEKGDGKFILLDMVCFDRRKLVQA